MIDVESKIRNRQYQSPSRARSALHRSSLRNKDKQRLGSLIDVWEGEGPVDHVVAGLPEREALEAELVDVATGQHGARGPDPVDMASAYPRPFPLHATVLRISLNAAVRVKLTVLGIAQLHEVRHRVAVPPDLLERQGVWETTLWELMSALGPKFDLGDAPIVDCVIDVLDARTRA